MHKEILTSAQLKLLAIVKMFSKKFGLAGGSAVALHLGHRESIDFDLFSFEEFSNYSIKRKLLGERLLIPFLSTKRESIRFR